MTIQQNIDRIQTTHIGSLPRPHDLLDVMKAKYSGQPYEQKAYDVLLAKSVADVVRRQVEWQSPARGRRPRNQAAVGQGLAFKPRARRQTSGQGALR